MHILDLLGSIGIIWDNLGSMHNKTNNLGFFVYIFKKGSLIGMIGIISEKTWLYPKKDGAIHEQKNKNYFK